VSNATRTLMIHSPTDIAKRWQGKDPKTDRPPFELAANLFVYATGMSAPRNRIDTLAVEDRVGNPSAVVPIARLKHGGNWDPEPWAWQRMSKLFRRETNVALHIVPLKIEDLTTSVAPIAHLTDTSPFKLSDEQIAVLKKYVEGGGVLLIDPCGGTPATAPEHPRSRRGAIVARQERHGVEDNPRPDRRRPAGHGVLPQAAREAVRLERDGPAVHASVAAGDGQRRGDRERSRHHQRAAGDEHARHHRL
jgi:hypothetical protein